jgi:hypothetical protein
LEKRLAANKAAGAKKAEEELQLLEAEIAASRLGAMEVMIASIDGGRQAAKGDLWSQDRSHSTTHPVLCTSYGREAFEKEKKEREARRFVE